MKYIVYLSTSVHLMSDAELKQLLEQSRLNNLKNDLTGMLLYSDGTFVQVLEGDESKVDETYTKILSDSRHKNIIKIDEGSIDERIFPDWNMGFRNVAAQDLAEFSGYINPGEQKKWLNSIDHPAAYILKTFTDTNRF